MLAVNLPDLASRLAWGAVLRLEALDEAGLCVKGKLYAWELLSG